MKPPASWNQFMWCTVVVDDSWKTLFGSQFGVSPKIARFQSLPFFPSDPKKFSAVCGTQISQNLLHVADSQSLAEKNGRPGDCLKWRRSARWFNDRDRSWSPNLEVTSSPFKLGSLNFTTWLFPKKRSRFHPQNLPGFGVPLNVQKHVCKNTPCCWALFFASLDFRAPKHPFFGAKAERCTLRREDGIHIQRCFCSLHKCFKTFPQVLPRPPPWTSCTSTTFHETSMVRLYVALLFCCFSVVFFVREILIVMESHMPLRILRSGKWIRNGWEHFT